MHVIKIIWTFAGKGNGNRNHLDQDYVRAGKNDENGIDY